MLFFFFFLIPLVPPITKPSHVAPPSSPSHQPPDRFPRPPPHLQHPHLPQGIPSASPPTLPLPGPPSVSTFRSRLKSVFCVKGLSLWSHKVCHALRPPPSAVGRIVGGEVFGAGGPHSPGIGRVVGTCTSTRVLVAHGVLGMWRGFPKRRTGHFILGGARDIQVSQDRGASLLHWCEKQAVDPFLPRKLLSPYPSPHWPGVGVR